MERFVNREDELSRLRGCYESDAAELIVLFGRRRLGKTQLVTHSLADRDDAVVYQATETTQRIQLDEFVEIAADTFSGITEIKGNWEALLGYLGDHDAVVVLDEFPYLIDADGSLPSVIQRLWDQRFQTTSATLVLIGSSISMMEEATLLGNSPLYGRFTEKLDLRPLDFSAAQAFVPNEYSPEERIFVWVFLAVFRTTSTVSAWNAISGGFLPKKYFRRRDISTTNRSTYSERSSPTRIDTLRFSPR